MFFKKTPEMEVDVIAILKVDHGYTVSIQHEKNGTLQFSLESEDSVLDLVAELVTGRVDLYDEEEAKVDLTN